MSDRYLASTRALVRACSRGAAVFPIHSIVHPDTLYRRSIVSSECQLSMPLARRLGTVELQVALTEHGSAPGACLFVTKRRSRDGHDGGSCSSASKGCLSSASHVSGLSSKSADKSSSVFAIAPRRQPVTEPRILSLVSTVRGCGIRAEWDAARVGWQPGTVRES